MFDHANLSKSWEDVAWVFRSLDGCSAKLLAWLHAPPVTCEGLTWITVPHCLKYPWTANENGCPVRPKPCLCPGQTTVNMFMIPMNTSAGSQPAAGKRLPPHCSGETKIFELQTVQATGCVILCAITRARSQKIVGNAKMQNTFRNAYCVQREHLRLGRYAVCHRAGRWCRSKSRNVASVVAAHCSPTVRGHLQISSCYSRSPQGTRSVDSLDSTLQDLSPSRSSDDRQLEMFFFFFFFLFFYFFYFFCTAGPGVGPRKRRSIVAAAILAVLSVLILLTHLLTWFRCCGGQWYARCSWCGQCHRHRRRSC